jgi:hypothetical protein
MTSFIVGVVVGLVVGWNLLPQPQWVKDFYERMKSYIR